MSLALDAAAEAAGVVLERPGESAAPVLRRHQARRWSTSSARRRRCPHRRTRSPIVPPWLDTTRAFGVALQLYQLRSERNLGIGDLADLKALIPMLADSGADFIGLNPLHALFTAAPERASPFSPSDRRRLNPSSSPSTRCPATIPRWPRWSRCRAPPKQVDYTAAAHAKLTVLRQDPPRVAGRATPACRPKRDTPPPRYASEAGAAVADFALFEALSHHMAESGKGAGWTSWPAEYADRSSAAVRAFAEAHRNEIAFHVWLQHIAEAQLAEAHQACLAAGMRIGLYLDLAVGEAPDGASTWADPSLALRGAEDRRAARPLLAGRAGLGPCPAVADGAGGAGLRPLPRGDGCGDGGRRRHAHRPRHGPGAAVADPRRHARRRGGLRAPAEPDRPGRRRHQPAPRAWRSAKTSASSRPAFASVWRRGGCSRCASSPSSGARTGCAHRPAIRSIRWPACRRTISPRWRPGGAATRSTCD